MGNETTELKKALLTAGVQVGVIVLCTGIVVVCTVLTRKRTLGNSMVDVYLAEHNGVSSLCVEYLNGSMNAYPLK